MKKIPFFIMGILLPALTALAQSPLITRALSIGDTVPDIVFNNIINYKNGSVKLSDFKGKLVIIDFWATWCSTCVHQFPKNIALKGSFGSGLDIIIVNQLQSTGDSVGNVRAFLDNWQLRTGQVINFYSACETTATLDSLFPHRYLPHYIWIEPSGRVRAITSRKEVTEENIQAMLISRDVLLPVKPI